MIENKSITSLRKIAKNIRLNRIFHSGMIENPHDILSVFPIIKIVPKYFDLENIGLIYSYYSDALNIKYNDYPIFTTCKFLNINDAQYVHRLNIYKSWIEMSNVPI